MVLGNAQIYNDARIYAKNYQPQTSIEGNAKIHGQATIVAAGRYDSVNINGNAQVFSNAKITGGKISGNAKVYDNTEISAGNISGNAKIFGNAKISVGNIQDNVQIYGNSEISLGTNNSGQAGVIYGNAKVYGNAHLEDSVEISEHLQISGNAKIGKINDYFSIYSIGSEDESLTAFKQSDQSIMISHGDLNVTIDIFEYLIKERHKEGQYRDVYLVLIETIKKQLA